VAKEHHRGGLGLARLHERQHLEGLVHGAEAAREDDGSLRVLHEHGLAHKEVAEAHAEVHPLVDGVLKGKLDPEPHGGAARLRGPAVCGLHDARAAVLLRKVCAGRGQVMASRADWAWLAPQLVALLAMGALVVTGVYREDGTMLLRVAGCVLAFGLLGVVRGPLVAWMGAGAVRHGVCQAVLFVAVVGCSFFALEVTYNTQWLPTVAAGVIVELVLLVMIHLFLYFVGQRRGAGMGLGVVACYAMGLALYFVYLFKGEAILPTDLLALGTAAAVAGGYTYVLSAKALLGLAFAMAGVCAASFVRPLGAEPSQGRHVALAKPGRGRPGRAGLREHPVARNFARALAVAAALAAFVTIPNYKHAFGLPMLYWRSMVAYSTQGFLSSFVSACQNMSIEVPEGYSQGAAAQLEDNYAQQYDQTLGSDPSRQEAVAQFGEQQPTVIVVMDEAFSDLSMLSAVSGAGYAGPSFLHGSTDALEKGSLLVSVLGGGTCNTEFEFLTGISMGYVGGGKYPYQMYDLSSAPSLAKELDVFSQA
jgi:hypothetical protein